MSDKSSIEWTDATWNPTTGCDRVSPGCAHCYALDLAARLKRMGQEGYGRDGDPRTSGPGFGLTLHPARLDQPLRWARPRKIFVNSMSDVFHELVPFEYVDRIFAVMALAHWHTFQVLTKRPERMREYMLEPRREGRVRAAIAALPARDQAKGRWPGWPVPNVWLGTSVENDRWTTRVDKIRDLPAAVRFLSCEPLLGPLPSLELTGIDWVIVGGESGPVHRPVRAEWIREIRDRCHAARVPFHFKQWGGRTSKSGGRTLDGRTYDEFPTIDVRAVAAAS